MKALETGTGEPIAIVGIGCRLPCGIHSPAAFWQLLREAREVVGEVPEGRWKVPDLFHHDPDRPGKIYTRRGGFVDGIELFDADFFGISPREASRIDPQQRLLLEVAWEALEDASQVPERLAGTRTGVFVGIYADDYWNLQRQDRASINAYTNSGGSASIAANRVSYTFDFRGPSLAVDTACSSALTAVHLACRSLWCGESELALAGGVHLMLRPETSIGFCKASMLSPTGRCWTFDARADGYVRGEGAGMVVLKPLARAVADGDPIYALIAATGVNQDGHTPGISVPSAAAQEALLRDVCRRAGVSPERVQYVEAHGTGTPVGDPIECHALGNALGADRPPPTYLRIGSVKTNIGHTESAAGIFGLMKLALAIHYRELPASLHFERPNPKIDFEALRLRVQQQTEPWPDGDEAIGGVASFGFGGTNAHVLVKSYPARPPSGTVEDCPSVVHLLPISARSRAAMTDLAKKYRHLLGGDQPLNLHDLCYSASVRRNHHDHRLALVGDSHKQFVELLDAFLAEERRPAIAVGHRPPGRKPRVAFVFSGNGPQWWGMARQLLDREPIFHQTVEDCDRALAPLAGWSLLRELLANEATSRMSRTDVAQPALFAVQLGLAAMWRSWGIEPEVVVGHSVGEVAAACVAGILRFDDAVRVIYERSRTQELTAGKGRMAAVTLAPEEIERHLAGREGRVSVAAVNAPNAVTLTGDPDCLEEVISGLERQNIFCRRLRLNYAFHSHHMDPVRQDLLDSLAGIAPQPAQVRFLSTVTGADLKGPECGPVYWWDNVRRPVLFRPGLKRLVRDGLDFFLEIGPHPVLTGYVSDCAQAAGKTVSVAPSLRRLEEDVPTLLRSLAALYADGHALNWETLYPWGGNVIKLPAYPWQRERHWNEPEDRSLLKGPQVHPLLGQRVDVPEPHWQVQLDRRALSYLDHHRLQGTTVFPATGYIEMALAAGRSQGEGTWGVDDLDLKEALVLPERQTARVQLLVVSDFSFAVSSRSQTGGAGWQTHATGQLVKKRSAKRAQPVSIAQIRSRCSRELNRDEFYRKIGPTGLQYTASFQGLSHVWLGDGEALGEVVAPDAVARELQDYYAHPALLDACLQVVEASLLWGQPDVEQVAYIPVRFSRVRFLNRPGARLYAHARSVRRAGGGSADLIVLDEIGNVVATFEGMQLRTLDLRASGTDCICQLKWQPQALAGAGPSVRDARCLAAPHELAESVRTRTAELATELRLGHFYEVIEPRMHAHGIACIQAAFHRLGCSMRPGEKLSAPDLMRRSGVLARHQRLVRLLLEMLASENILKRSETDEWEICSPLPEVNPNELWRRLLRDYPEYLAELTLMGQCGRHLVEVLREDVDPLELIFPEKSGTAEQLYDSAPTSRFYHTLLGYAVAELIARLPQRRSIRMLEIGGGTGGTSAHILPHLPADRTSYTFTDLSSVFLARAEHRFRDYPFLEYRLLNIEEDPAEQGFEPNSFDVVIAANVLHATRDLRQTLTNVKRLLASQGILALLEISKTSRWLDLVFGLLKGWWLFNDEELRAHPLLTGEKWAEVLGKAGFSEVACLSDPRIGGEPLQSTFLARGPTIAAKFPPAVQETPPSGKWLLFADRTGLADDLCRQLASRGQRVVMVARGEAFAPAGDLQFTVNPQQSADLRRLLQAVTADAPPLIGVIHAWSLDVPDSDDTTTLDSLEEAQDLGCLSAIHLVQTLVEYGKGTPRVWLVTRGSQAESRHSLVVGVAQAPLWGLVRTVTNEHPELRCTLIDVSAPARGRNGSPFSPREIQNLAAHLLSDDPEEEILLRDDMRYVSRLAMTSPAPPVLPRQDLSENESYRLEVTQPGDLDMLSFLRIPKQGPGPGEVAIESRAVGLNFKDLMQATGLLSGPALEAGFSRGLSLGLECAGRVAAVGEGVDQFRIGDEVMAMGRHCFSPWVITAAAAVARKPAGLTFEEAATIPAVFLTAYYALCHLARIRSGESVLVHAAAGGVGLAAVQIVQRAGGVVLATAGSAEKREFLKALGVSHVLDSRSLTFAEEVMDITRGEGVDVVLNSLGGEGLVRSLALLKRFGRFLEIGKRDLVQNSKVGLRPFERCLSFHSIDLDQLLRYQAATVLTLFREIVAAMEQGELRPLPYRVFPIHRVADAFRCMQQSRHIGKLVVSLAQQEVAIRNGARNSVRFRGDASYLITGGLGGVGLALAEWMAANGARHLVLAGRRGAETAEATTKVHQLQAAGTNVLVARMDSADPVQVGQVFAEIQRAMPPLRGVFHGALVLDDGILLQQNRERLLRVLRPKMHGAWNLHCHTRGLSLDHFVLFSSFVSLVGNPGQSNYAAANAFLDALAYYRRSLGLPALTVNWGSLAQVGYMQRHADLGDRLARRGGYPLEIATALETLGRMLVTGWPQVGIAHVDWQKWKAMARAPLSKLAAYAGKTRDELETGPVRGLPGDLSTMLVAERRQFVQSRLCSHVAHVLGTTDSRVEINKPMTLLGLDSLMAVDLRVRIERDLGVAVPVMNLMQTASVEELSNLVVEQLDRRAPPGPMPLDGVPQTPPADDFIGGPSRT
jgi:acyl transferase domain-containing protein/NADPH:quinone reductase-like Zn-dependent oxidoreductase/SAM-dependent methyltransferase/acyl carrier protein